MDDEPSPPARRREEVARRTEREHLFNDQPYIDESAIVEFRWHGPMPPPAAVRGYEDILPGSAERILSMAESQVAHRHAIESHVVRSNVDRERIGQYIGAALAALIIIGGFIAIFTNHSTAGLVVLLPGLVGLVGLFVYSQRRERSELRAARRELALRDGDGSDADET